MDGDADEVTMTSPYSKETYLDYCALTVEAELARRRRGWQQLKMLLPLLLAALVASALGSVLVASDVGFWSVFLMLFSYFFAFSVAAYTIDRARRWWGAPRSAGSPEQLQTLIESCCLTFERWRRQQMELTQAYDLADERQKETKKLTAKVAKRL